MKKVFLLVILVLLTSCGAGAKDAGITEMEEIVSSNETISEEAPLAEASSEEASPNEAPPDESQLTAESSSAEPPFKIFITSDIHVFFDAMHDGSETFKEFESSGDAKMLSYTDPVMNAFVNDILTEKPDAVIITGDLTLNGEKTGHEMLAELLAPVREAGIQVYVIPGNHDINNPYARQIHDGKFELEEYVTPEQFEEIYSEFGYKEPLYRDAETLSYIAELSSGLYAVMLDTAMYESNIEQQRSNASGTVYDETAGWLRKCVGEIKAGNPGARFITAMHHNLFAHHSNFDFGYVLYSAPETRLLFEELGLDAVFSGHIHVQHILKQGNITEVVDSALIVYPVAYGVIEADGEGLKYRTREVDMKRWADQNGITDGEFQDFEKFSRESFNERAASGMSEMLRGLDYPEEDIEAAVSVIKMINTYYFAGRIDEVKDEIISSEGYKILEETGSVTGYIESVFKEGAGEHNSAEIPWRK